jgi:hypothetical protein
MSTPYPDRGGTCIPQTDPDEALLTAVGSGAATEELPEGSQVAAASAKVVTVTVFALFVCIGGTHNDDAREVFTRSRLRQGGYEPINQRKYQAELSNRTSTCSDMCGMQQRPYVPPNRQTPNRHT